MPYFQALSSFFRLPFHVQWRTFLVQLPRYVPLSILHITSPKGPHPFIIALPSRANHKIPIYVFIPPDPVRIDDNGEASQSSRQQEEDGVWKVPVLLDFHGGGFIMGSPLEQAPYCAMMSRELGAVCISVSYRIGPFHQFPAAIHDAEDVLAAVQDTEGATEGGKVLRQEIQKQYTMIRRTLQNKHNRSTTALPTQHLPPNKHTIKLDPTHLTISGFSAGGNIALNLATSVPAVADTPPSPDEITSPLLYAAPNRRQTILDDPTCEWPSLLPTPHALPRQIPLLLFYPSLDARLLPHERPPKVIPGTTMQISNPRRPGLFSIMGPTYLPKKLRGHPRASPGLSDPRRDIRRNVSMLLVLPEHDSLAVQSEVWLDKMREGGWEGPTRYGDGREGDWDGRRASREARGEMEMGRRSQSERLGANGENGGLEVWHAPGMKHGWTQFPNTWLKKPERRERDLVFERALDFVKEAWRRPPPPLAGLVGMEGRF